MKKIVTAVALLALALPLTACQPSGPGSDGCAESAFTKGGGGGSKGGSSGGSKSGGLKGGSKPVKIKGYDFDSDEDC